MAKAARILGLLGSVCALAGVGGCGDRAGDPVVPFEATARTSNQNPGGGPFDGGVETLSIPGGPCTPCVEAGECGGHDDLCVQNAQTRDRFCAIECDDRQGCPNGYRCVGVQDSNLSQCVPETDDCSHVLTAIVPPLEVMRAEAMARLNHLRSEFFLPPFAETDCLDRLAQESAIELAQTGNVRGKFENECEQIQPEPCECGWGAQAERRTIELGLTWAEAVDRLMDRGMDPDDPLSLYVSWPEHVNVGFGIVLSGDAAWTAVSFGR